MKQTANVYVQSDRIIKYIIILFHLGLKMLKCWQTAETLIGLFDSEVI